MKTLAVALLLSLASAGGPEVFAQASKYPPLDKYLMPADAEIALARSAAPASVSERATVKVLTRSGYQVAQKGDNGVVCMVLRGFAAPTYSPPEVRDLVYDPTVRAPICFVPPADRAVMPYYEFRTKLAMKGMTPDEIAQAVAAAYTTGGIPRRDTVSFGYMWSADQQLGPAGAFHPHMMVFAPYAENSILAAGNGPPDRLPLVSDDARTPFAVVVIPVDDRLAIKSRVASTVRER